MVANRSLSGGLREISFAGFLEALLLRPIGGKEPNPKETSDLAGSRPIA